MLFIELLQVSLGTRDTLSRVPTPAEWASLMQEAQKQAISGVFADGIERLPANQRPPKAMLLQWIGLVQITEQQYALHCQRAKELTQRFLSQGVKSTVLKGIGLAQYYPHPAHRQCGDIDLWVGRGRREVMPYLRSEYEIGLNVWHHVDARIFQDLETEIHFHSGWLYNPRSNKRLQKWFDEQRDRQMCVNENLGFAYPTVQFNAVYSLLHSYHHLIEEGLGLRHIIDYYFILKALPVEEKEFVVSLLKRFELIRFAGAMMWVLKEVCGMPAEYLIGEPNEKEGRFLMDEVMRGGNFGKYRKDSHKHNTASRMFSLLPHYPSEVLWVVPWKLWHKCWRLMNHA